jgi:hypothetical protein
MDGIERGQIPGFQGCQGISLDAPKGVIPAHHQIYPSHVESGAVVAHSGTASPAKEIK